MKAILALATLALVTLVLEEKARQVASEAKDAYGAAVVQTRDTTQSAREAVKQKPLPAVAIAAAVGFMLAKLTPQ